MARLIDWINPFKTAWYYTDEWVKQAGYITYSIEEEYGSSWDVSFVRFEEYRNKKTGETRVRRRGKEMDLGPGKSKSITKTTFENPRSESFSINYLGSEIGTLDEQMKEYTGPTYE